MVQTRGEADDGRSTADAILAHVREARLGSGRRIPTERELGADLGLTRHSLRKALALLEADGWISREVGRGTFLRLSALDSAQPSLRSAMKRHGAPTARRRTGAAGAVPARGEEASRASDPAAPLRTDMADVGPADVMAVRHLLEPNAMPLVVARATSRDLEHMASCLQGGDRAVTQEEFEFWDLKLHRAILAASRNPLLMRMYDSLEDARHSPLWGDLKRRNSSDQRRADYRRDHQAIVDAIGARDSDRASEAMQAHLVRIDGHLFGGVG